MYKIDPLDSPDTFELSVGALCLRDDCVKFLQTLLITQPLLGPQFVAIVKGVKAEQITLGKYTFETLEDPDVLHGELIFVEVVQNQKRSPRIFVGYPWELSEWVEKNG